MKCENMFGKKIDGLNLKKKSFPRVYRPTQMNLITTQIRLQTKGHVKWNIRPAALNTNKH